MSLDSVDKDSIQIKFNESVFSDPLTDFKINEGLPLLIPLPRQIDPVKAEQLEEVLDTVESSANFVATGNLAVNIILGASLKYLWGMINTL